MMKKTLLLCTMALCMIFSVKAAMTDAELTNYLDGKLCLQFFGGNHSQSGLGTASAYGYFEKTANTKVRLYYFKAAYTIDFDVVNGALSTTAGTSSRHYVTDDSRNYMSIYHVSGSGKQFSSGRYSENINCYKRETSSAYTTLKSGAYVENMRETGFIGFDFTGNQNLTNACLAIQPSNENLYGDASVYNLIKFFVVEPNGIATETYDGSQYYARYDIDNNKISITNLGGVGVLYENKYTSPINVTFKATITSNIDSNGNFTIAPFKAGGFRDVWYYGYTSTLYTSFGTFSNLTLGYWYSQDVEGNYDNYISRNGTTGNINGKVYTNDFNHVLSTNNCYWAYDEKIKGSSLKTYAGDVVTLDQLTYYVGYNRNSYTSPVIFQRDFDSDITHSAGLNISRFGFGTIDNTSNNYMYAEGEISQVENADYVESYELYVIPGSYDAVTGAAFNNAENGHNAGFAIKDAHVVSKNMVETEQLRTMAVGSNDNAKFQEGKFAVLVPATDLSDALNGSMSNTFYLKANYTAESGLESTFHALAKTPTATSVDDLIHYDDEDAPVVYYNMNGVEVSGDALTPGLYIRKQGNNATKVVIK